MGLALQKSTDGGTTFQQVSLDVADYTTTGGVANTFFTVKDSNDTVYILAIYVPSGYTTTYSFKFIKITSSGTKSVATMASYYPTIYCGILLSRDESKLFFVTGQSSTNRKLYSVNVVDIVNNGTITPTVVIDNVATTNINVPFAIYKDQYIWVASGTTVKIYDYDTKAELATVSLSSTAKLLALNDQNIAYSIDNSGQLNSLSYNPPVPPTTTGIITKTNINSGMSNVMMQLLIDRFGDLIILTNTGTASTLLKYSNTGTLIDMVNLSVGTNKGAYGLQVYSSDNGTKCWVQFGNDLGTWRTEAKSYDATPANRTFGDVSKIRDNGVTVYGSDMGGDNNYSVRC